MGSPLRVTLVQLAYADDEPVLERTSRVADLVRSVCVAPEADGPPHLVVLPELWGPTGFGYQEWESRAEPLDGPTATAMAAVARECGIVLHAGSIVERLQTPGREGKRLANTSLVYGPDGARVAVYRKIHRFGFGAGEPRLMEAGEELVGLTLPTGHRAGLSTCYDLRFPELYRQYGDRDVELSLIPAAWPMARVEHWRVLLRARAIENQTFVLACNTAGTHAETEMGGHSAVIDPNGVVLAEAGEGEEVLRAEIDPSLVAQQRESFPVLRDRRL